LLLCAGGALVVELVAVGVRILLPKDAVASARPDAEAARLESEDTTADMVAAEGKVNVRV
jgi:nicotinamidase-related amidase